MIAVKPLVLWSLLISSSLSLIPVSNAATLYSDTIVDDEPVMYWNFDEVDGNAIQQMPLTPQPVGTENDLVPTPGTERVSHDSITSGLRLGNAADFKGTNFFRAAAMGAGKETLEGAYAIELWFQSQAANSATYLANFGPPGGDNSPAVIYNFNQDYLELYGGAGGRTGFSGPTITDQEWHHLLFVYYGDGFEGVAARVDAYLDGVHYPYIPELFSKRLSLASVIVGAALPSGVNAFTGRIDELAVYDFSELLDEAAVAAKAELISTGHRASAMAASGPTYSSVVLGDDPIVYWNFDEAEGNALQQAPVAPPVLDNALNELLPSGAAIRMAHQDLQSGLQLGNAATFDGQSSFQRTGGLDAPMPALDGPWALEMWFQFTEDQANRYLLNMGAGGRNSPAVIYGYFGPRLEVFGNGRSSTNGVPVSDQNWHHLLVVNYNTAPGSGDPGANPNRVDFFIDNVQYTHVGGGFNQPVNFGDWLIFGAATPDNSGGMAGRLDELAIYNLNGLGDVEAVETRAAELAASHYAAAFGGTSTGTITITQQPASAEGQLGQSVTFSVAATVTGTSSPLTYQWFRNGVAISEATNASYTTPPLSLYDVETNIYTVRVSAGAAFKLSDPAELVVPVPPAGPATAYSHAVMNDDPLVYWNFDEMTGPARQLMSIPVDPITTENDLAPIGAAEFRTSHADLGSGLEKLGNALVLDGFSYMQAAAPRLSSSSLEGPWAVEFWMQFQGLPGAPVDAYIANFGNPGADNSPALIYGFTVDRLEVYGGAFGRSGENGPLLTDNEWHHVVWVNYDTAPANSNNRVDVYVDGVAFPNAGGGFNRPLSLSSFLFGAATTLPANGFPGALDEFAVYDLSGLDETQLEEKAAELAAHSALARSSGGESYSEAVLEDDPLLYYNFNESGGAAQQLAPITLPAVDSLKNDLHPGSAGRVQHSLIEDGRNLGNAADFDGKSYFLASQLDVRRQLLGPWAIEFWMQVTGVNNTERESYLMNFAAASPALTYDFKPDELELFSGNVRTDLGPVISDDQWHHVMWVFYGDGVVGVSDRVDAYLDGVSLPFVRNTFTSPLNLTGTLLVGASTPGYSGFLGRLDEIAVYDLSSIGDEAAITARVEELVSTHLQAAASTTVALSISRTGSSITLSWETAGYTLQENDDIGDPTGWTNVAGASPVTVTVPPSGSKFYRVVQE